MLQTYATDTVSGRCLCRQAPLWSAAFRRKRFLMNALRPAALSGRLCAASGSLMPRPRPRRPSRRPDPAVDPKVPQPGQQDKIFPLGSSWVAVSLNGKPFGGDRPSFSLDDQLRATRLWRLQQLFGHGLSPPRAGPGGRPVRADQEGVRQERHGIRAGLPRGAAHRRRNGTSGRLDPRSSRPRPANCGSSGRFRAVSTQMDRLSPLSRDAFSTANRVHFT